MNNIFSVSDINKYIKSLLSQDFVLSKIMIRGEISNYKAHYSGHLYFTLKDGDSILKCVMFKSQASLLRFIPENGLKVIAGGNISVYERDGIYQLYVNNMQPDGLGALNLAYEQLKNKLEKEGLFDKSAKKPLPYLPECVGVITSSTGAVIRDIINVSIKRFGNVNLKLLPVAVQGQKAAYEIAEAIKIFNKLKCVEVIILARGGGSLEDLWAFNEEVVARSIFDSKIPVISAVGHETDFTISDFVSDLRASTPSHAAQLAWPDKIFEKNRLGNLKTRLYNAINKQISTEKNNLENIKQSVVFKQPMQIINEQRYFIDNKFKFLINAINNLLSNKRSNFSVISASLNALSPLTILSRGYAVAKKEGKIVKSVSDIKDTDKIKLILSDGEADCLVEGVESNGARK